MIYQEQPPDGVLGFRVERREVLMQDGIAAGVDCRDCVWTDNLAAASAEAERLIAEEPGDHDLPQPLTGRYAERLVEDPDVDRVWRVSPLLSFAVYDWPSKDAKRVCRLEECDNPTHGARDFCSRRCATLHYHRDRGRAAYRHRAELQWTWPRIGRTLPAFARLADPRTAAIHSAQAYARTAGLPWPPIRRNARGEKA